MELGGAAQILADRLKVPSGLFLILAGVLVGAEGLGVITPAAFGDPLLAIVGLSVAIIVFKGAFHLHVDRLRQAPAETIRHPGGYDQNHRNYWNESQAEYG